MKGNFITVCMLLSHEVESIGLWPSILTKKGQYIK